MGFAQNLDYLMQTKGMTKYQLAKEIGCHQTSVTNWLENGTVPQKRTLGAISNLFGLSVDELCSDVLPVLSKKENPTVSGEVNYSDIELLSAFNSADEATKQAIRLILGLK